MQIQLYLKNIPPLFKLRFCLTTQSFHILKNFHIWRAAMQCPECDFDNPAGLGFVVDAEMPLL